MSNIVERKINGIVYKAQFKGIAHAIQFMEQVDIDDSTVITAEKLFDEVLISPPTTIDDFDSIEEFYEVYDFLLDAVQGNVTNGRNSKSRIKKKVKENWGLWRLVLSNRGFDYQTVFGKSYMTPQDVIEANIALDMQIEAEKNAAKKK